MLCSAQLTVCCQLFPHQWNLQNSGGEREEKYDVQNRLLQSFTKSTYPSKLTNSLTQQTAIYMLTSTMRTKELDSLLYRKERTNFPSAPFPWLLRFTSASPVVNYLL